MSEVTNLAVVARETAGKGAARATRRQGLVPGVVYGNKQPSVTVAVDPRKLWAELNKPGLYTRLFNVQIEGGKNELALFRDLQRHPVTDQPIHFDLQRVSPDSKIHVRVPVHFINQEESPGIKHGGMLNIIHHELELAVTADHIPSALEIDLGSLDIGAIVHLSALTLPAGASVVTHEKDLTIATIVAPTVAPTETPAAGETAPAA